LLSVNVLSNSLSATFLLIIAFILFCVSYQELLNNGDSHKNIMWPNVQTCILEVNKIGIKLSIDIV